jgi:hypothetical protein
MCASTFSTAFNVDERPDHRTRLEPVGDLHRTGSLGEPLGERIINAVLNQDAVGAHTGLAGIAIFRGGGALDGHLDIGVVKDDDYPRQPRGDSGPRLN